MSALVVRAIVLVPRQTATHRLQPGSPAPERTGTQNTPPLVAVAQHVWRVSLSEHRRARAAPVCLFVAAPRAWVRMTRG